MGVNEHRPEHQYVTSVTPIGSKRNTDNPADPQVVLEPSERENRAS